VGFPWLLELWIGDPVIGSSQWFVATLQGVVRLDLIMVDRWSCYRYKSVPCRNSTKGGSPWLLDFPRSHAHDSGFLLFLNENGNEDVSCLIAHDMTSESDYNAIHGQWSWNMYILWIKKDSHWQNPAGECQLLVNMCQWHECYNSAMSKTWPSGICIGFDLLLCWSRRPFAMRKCLQWGDIVRS